MRAKFRQSCSASEDDNAGSKLLYSSYMYLLTEGTVISDVIPNNSRSKLTSSRHSTQLSNFNH